MDADELRAAHAAIKEQGLNPGALGERLLSELAEQRAAAPLPVVITQPKVMSDEEREIAFLLSYNGDDKGLLWRKENTVREVARQQAVIERQEQEVRCVLSRYQAHQTKAKTDLKKMITDECFKVAHGVGQHLGQVVEGLEKQLTEVRIDLRIATKRAELAELNSEIATAAARREQQERGFGGDLGLGQSQVSRSYHA